MLFALPTYRPRDAEHTVLHAVIREHLETFLNEAATDPDGRTRAARFVEEEFRAFLRCGVLAHGFAGCGATVAGWTASCRFRAKGAGSARAAGAGG